MDPSTVDQNSGSFQEVGMLLEIDTGGTPERAKKKAPGGASMGSGDWRYATVVVPVVA